MVHCTLNGLICRHKHVKNVLLQHLGELLGVLDLRTSKQVKSKRYFPQHRNGVAVKVYGKERLSIFRLLDCETAGATVGLLFRHIAQYRTEPVTNPEVRAAHYPLGKHRWMEAELPVEKAAQEPIGFYLLDTIPQRHSGKARLSFFFVLIRLLRKPLTPDLLSRLQALSPDLLLRGALARNDPSDSELCLLTAVLNYNHISNLHLASIATQLHTMVADIESMREMAILTPGDPESYWYDRFGSLRPPFAYAKSRHVPPRSLRVAVVGRVVIIVIFFLAVVFVFLFVLFLVWCLPQDYIGGCRVISGFWVDAIQTHCCHGQIVRPVACPKVRFKHRRGSGAADHGAAFVQKGS